MKLFFSLPIIKRKSICGLMGIGFGFLCAYLASNSPEIKEMYPAFWGSAMMWAIVFNRTLIGIVVFIAGAFTKMPFFDWRYHPVLRGASIGAFVSLDMAIGAIIGNPPNATMIFWMTIGAGAIYGLIIDVVATKFAGEGKKLFEY